jgi:hypothetical protein
MIRLAAMPGRLRTTLLTCALAAAVGGCGSGNDGTIPKQDADNLVSVLDGIESDLAAHDCALIPQHVSAFADQVNALPQEVDDEVEKGLIQGADQLIELSKEPGQCEDVSGVSGATSTEPDTTTTESVESSTTSSTTSTSTTTQSDEESPPEQNGGNQDNGPLEVPGGGEGGGGGRSGGNASGGLEGGKRG